LATVGSRIRRQVARLEDMFQYRREIVVDSTVEIIKKCEEKCTGIESF
jgi:hypothetical protein